MFIPVENTLDALISPPLDPKQSNNKKSPLLMCIFADLVKFNTNVLLYGIGMSSATIKRERILCNYHQRLNLFL